VAALAMVVVVVLALVTPRTRGNFGGPGDFNGQGGQGAPQGQQAGGQGGQNNGQGGQFGGGQGGGQGAPQGGGPQQGGGFPEGGPGEGGPRGFSTLPLIIGGVLLVIFAGLALFLILQLWRGRAALTSPVDVASLNPGREVLPAFISLAATAIAVLLVAQLVPVARDNPPVQTQVTFDSPATQQLFTNACADCHSNETQRPWYAYIAPGSWLLASHISAGRNQWNISELNNLPGFRLQQLPNQISQNLRDNMMPPADYRLMHPAANLTDAEKAQLIAGLQKAVASVP
jgi:mono/diheme cytochrome c family protein